MLRTALAAALIAAATLLAPFPATADTPGCVTRGEFRAVDNGWTKARVHRRFDTDGWFHNRVARIVTRRYLACESAPVDSYFVMYRKRGGVWRVVDKV